MKKIWMIAAALLVVSSAAQATVAEAKAKKASEAKVAKAAAAASKACGASIAASVDWTNIDGADFGNTNKEDVISWAGDYASLGLKQLTKLCADKDYQAAAAKVKKYVAVGDATTTTATFTLKDDVITEHFKPTGTSDTNVDKAVQALF